MIENSHYYKHVTKHIILITWKGYSWHSFCNMYN